jgi:hypothetical protein
LVHFFRAISETKTNVKVGVDISASNIILFDTYFGENCLLSFVTKNFFFDFEIFPKKVGFSGVEIKGKIKEDLQ